MQIAGEEIERLRRQIMEQIDLTRTVEDEEVYQLIEAQVRDFARERMLDAGGAGSCGGRLCCSVPCASWMHLHKELLADPAITGKDTMGKRCRTYPPIEKAGRLAQSGSTGSPPKKSELM